MSKHAYEFVRKFMHNIKDKFRMETTVISSCYKFNNKIKNKAGIYFVHHIPKAIVQRRL